jgi:hypothetical protein
MYSNLTPIGIADWIIRALRSCGKEEEQEEEQEQGQGKGREGGLLVIYHLSFLICNLDGPMWL